MESSRFVRIDPADFKHIAQTPALAALAARASEIDAEATTWAQEIDAARKTYASDDVEIDDSPSVSVADDGVWVSAWVWVARTDNDQTDEED